MIGMAAHAQSTIDSLQLVKDVRTLSDDKFEGRRTGSRGSRMAQFYLLDRFKKIGIQAYNNAYEYPFYFQDGDKRTMGTNLYGYIPGKTTAAIVITAHYDHLGIRSGQAGKDSIFNGADDNASGVGALLAIAAWYKKHTPEHTLIFAALDGEEEGLQGAKAFLQKPPVPVTNMLLNINMDMVGRNARNELYVCGLRQFPALKQYVDAANTGSNGVVKLLSGHDGPENDGENWINQSDHYEFYKLKVPSLYFGVEDHPDYHKVSDEFKGIQPAFYYQAVQRILKVLQAADKGITGSK